MSRIERPFRDLDYVRFLQSEISKRDMLLEEIKRMIENGTD